LFSAAPNSGKPEFGAAGMGFEPDDEA
jgi:hypothetical protein